MKIINAHDLKTLLDRNEVFLIDVREPIEHQTESIDGACLIPLDEISLKKLPSRSRPIVVHCRSGKRSIDACKKLLEQDPALEIYSLEGGILGWHQAGFSVKKLRNNILPLERQTQLVSGLLAFSSTILGAFINPLFYVIAGFIGLGLMFAGASGWCGMAKLLAKMPWNN